MGWGYALRTLRCANGAVYAVRTAGWSERRRIVTWVGRGMKRITLRFPISAGAIFSKWILLQMRLREFVCARHMGKTAIHRRAAETQSIYALQSPARDSFGSPFCLAQLITCFFTLKSHQLCGFCGFSESTLSCCGRYSLKKSRNHNTCESCASVCEFHAGRFIQSSVKAAFHVPVEPVGVIALLWRTVMASAEPVDCL